MENYLIHTDAIRLTQSEFIIRMLVTIGIGFIIGLEREFSAMNDKMKAFAGIRTFVFIVLLGFLSGMVYHLLSPWIYLAIFAAVVTLTAMSYFVTANKGDVGATTEFTVLISFILGTFTFLGIIQVSLMITVFMVVLLSAKVKLQSFIGNITAEELYDFLRFVVIALLLFPFLPDKSFGYNNVINPHEIGWVIILTSGLGFIGYILMRILGTRKGILLGGIVGGLVSSTAVTWIFSKKSAENESLSDNCAVAILAASSIMVIRILVWVFIFNPVLFSEIYIPLLLVFLAAISTTLFFYFKKASIKTAETDFQIGKPLDLLNALVFGLIYATILLATSYANNHLGHKGVLISSSIAGLSDIDAISISISKLAGVQINLSYAQNAILLATISNTLVKMGIGFWAGSKTLRKNLLIGYGIVSLVILMILLF